MSTTFSSPPFSSSLFPALYFDGRSARRHAVHLELSRGVIGVIGVAGAPGAPTYAFHQARMAEPFAHAPCVIDLDDGARLEVADADARAALAQALCYRPSPVERLQRHWYAALLSLVVLVVAVGALVQWGVPVATEHIVRQLPPAADIEIGKRSLAALRGKVLLPSRLSDHRIAEVLAIFDKVKPHKPRIPLTFVLMDMPRKPPNALAFPNGTIVLTDAMVRHALNEHGQLDAAAEAKLAAVLAHEIGHIEQRHSMHAIVRASLLGAGSAALFGDFSAVAAAAPVALLNMDYSRAMETAADDHAIRRLRELGIPTAPLADLFDALAKQTPGMSKLPKWLSKNSIYLSSHPASRERSERFRRGLTSRELAAGQ